MNEKAVLSYVFDDYAPSSEELMLERSEAKSTLPAVAAFT